MVQEPEIKRWTAKRKSELVKEIMKGQTTSSQAAREYDLTISEVEKWIDDAMDGMENALKSKPKDIEQQYQKKIDELHAAYGEAMLELKFT